MIHDKETMTASNLDEFIQTFLPSPPKGDSPANIATRIRHWIDVYNHPEKFTDDHSPYALRAKKRSARQNVRRLAEKHPDIAGRIMAEAR